MVFAYSEVNAFINSYVETSINICTFHKNIHLNKSQNQTYLEIHTYHLDNHDQASLCTADARPDVPSYSASGVTVSG